MANEIDIQQVYGEVKSGVRTLDSLDPEVGRQLHEYMVSGMQANGGELPEAPETPATVVETPATEAPAEVETPETPVEVDDEEIEIESRRRLAEKAKTRETRLTELDAILDETEPDSLIDEDKWREWDKKQRAALREQVKINRQRDSEDAEENTRYVATASRDRTIASIGKDFPELKLPKPLDQMNAEYSAFDTKLLKEFGSEDRDAAFKKYATDKDFAAKVGAKPANLDTLFIYLRAAAQPGNFEGNVFAEARKAGVLARIRSAAAAESAEALAGKSAAALAKAGAVKPASMSGAGGEEPKPITRPVDKETARAWLQHVNAQTAAQSRTKDASLREKEDAWTSEAQALLSGATKPKNIFVRM